MNRPTSRHQLRKRAMLAFAARNRAQRLRSPANNETPLSADEVEFGVARGLIAHHLAPARAGGRP